MLHYLDLKTSAGLSIKVINGLNFVLLALHTPVFPGFRGLACCVRGGLSQKAMFLNRVHLEAVVGCPGEVAFLLQNKQRNKETKKQRNKETTYIADFLFSHQQFKDIKIIFSIPAIFSYSLFSWYM